MKKASFAKILLISLMLCSLLVPAASLAEAASVMTRVAEGQSVEAWGWDPPEFNLKVEEYITEASGVTVVGTTTTQTDERAKLIAAATAGMGMPDCFKMGSYDLALMVEIDAALDITDLVAPYMDLLPAVAWEMVTFDGKIYGIPANSPAAGMFYRYDVLEQYGIDPDALDTWDKWIEAGKTIIAQSNGEIGWMNGNPLGMPGYIATTIAQQCKAELLSKDGQITVNSDAYRTALAKMQEIKDAGIITEMDDWSAPWYESMRDGTLACYPSGTWFVQTLIAQAPDTQGKWYFTPFPAMEEGGDRYPNYGSATCYISSMTDKVDAAFEWCKAWTIDPMGSIGIGLEQLGISVISNTALEAEYVNQPHPYFAKEQAYWKVATEAFTNSTFVPTQITQTNEANGIWGRNFDLWYAGELSADQLLIDVEAEMQSKLEF